MRRLSWAVATVVVLLITGQAWAQQESSLADVARREAARRKTVKEPTKVYTNSDVKGGAPLTTAAVRPTTSTPGAQPGDKDKEKAPKAEAGEPVRDEAWWRKRAAELRDALNRSRLFAEALQSRVNALWADFTARDDPAQRSIIENSRKEALAELERVQGEIARQEQAIADLEEEARKANVPPGWLR
jgi:hypothetical protein